MAEPDEKDMPDPEKESSPTIIVLGAGLGNPGGLGALRGRLSPRRARLGGLTPHHERQLEFDISSPYGGKLYSPGLGHLEPRIAWYDDIDPSLLSETVEEESDPLSVRTYRRLLGEIANLDVEQIKEALAEEWMADEEPDEDSTAQERLEEIKASLRRSRQLGERAQRGIDALLERRPSAA